jgi:cytochrome c oxidase cbb3-type subunit 3
MVPWKATIKPSDIQKVSSYVLSLQGTNPKDPKPTEPESKKWVDLDTPKKANLAKPADTTKVEAKVVAVK